MTGFQSAADALPAAPWSRE